MGRLRIVNQVRFAFPNANEKLADVHDIRRWLHEKRREAMSATHAESTVKSYASQWRVFESFCDLFDYSCLPASFDTIADFLCAYSQDRSWATVRNSYSAIRYHHLVAGYPCHYPIEIKHLLLGLRRLHGRPSTGKRPLDTEIIKQICTGLDERGGIKSIRDKALLLGAYGAALRASEVVGQNLEHLTFDHRGVTILIPKSKTDQIQNGQTVSIPRVASPVFCPVVALEEWRDVLVELRGGARGVLLPVLRAGGDKALHEVRLVDRRLTTHDYRKILKDLSEDVGLNRDEIGGHSVRKAHATQAAENGASPFEIAAQGRWRSLQMVMTYVQMGKRFQNNSAHYLGL